MRLRASASAPRSESLTTSEMTRLTRTACFIWSSRVAAWLAMTCAISCDSTEASSQLSEASESRPRVTQSEPLGRAKAFTAGELRMVTR